VQPQAITPEPVPSPVDPPRAARLLSALQREVATVLLVLLVVVCALLSPSFLSVTNLLNLADAAPIFAILAAAQMLVILSGGIDLSVGSLMAVGAFFAAVMSFNNVGLAIVVPILVTGFLGFLDGALAAYTRVPPFIITLGMLSFGRGIAQLGAAVYQGASASGAGAQAVAANKTGLFQGISDGTPFGSAFAIPFGAFVAVAVFIGLAYTLRYTGFGRHVYAIGGNEAAAGLLGVRVRPVKMGIYAISGALSGLAGVLLASHLGSAPPTAGQGYELDAITAVVVGGTLLTGGVGTVRGTIVGLLVIVILPNIFNLLGLGDEWQQVVRGAVLLAVVLLQLVIVRDGSIGGLRLRRPPPPPLQGAPQTPPTTARVV